MKFSTASVLAACVPAVAGRFIEKGTASASDDQVVLHPEQKFLIETAPGKQQWVTDEDKWELRRNGINFMDITETRNLGASKIGAKAVVQFPKKVSQQKVVNDLAKTLSKSEMQKNLEKLTSFYTRYFRSETGLKSSDWVLEKVNSIIKEAGADKTVFAKSFPHPWLQHSVIATIPGLTNNTIVIGAHQDSTNLWLPSVLAAPGADDDGSGTVTIMEAFRTILSSQHVVNGKLPNRIEFHWYSAEEGGLLGSQAIFSEYERDGRVVKAMLQQDMTGYIQGTLDADKPESVGVIMDFVDPGLTKFIKTVIEEYCDIPWVETKCGYACSDHASASKAGYPSAFVIESAFEHSDPHIHTTEDLIKHLSFDHMLQHAKMTLGLAYELGTHDFDKDGSLDNPEL
ncbi:hypothetical protein MY10362_000858 [Beauveria mimosiformis]